jgi:DNA replication protein DnaD
MSKPGFIKLYRYLLDKPIWIKSTPEQKTILVTLLLMVNYEEKEWEWMGEKFKVLPGQVVTSLDKIVEAAGKGITIQNVRSAIVRFQKLGFLTNKSTKTGRLITIENWEVYQDGYVEPNKDTNKEVTKTQQRGNKEVTPNKKDKNIKELKEGKEDNRIIYAEKVKMLQSEFEKLVSDYGETATKEMIDILNNYKLSSGKVYKDDYRAILSWVVGEYNKRHSQNKSQQGKPQNFNNFQQRKYDGSDGSMDFDSLERKLLGWDK